MLNKPPTPKQEKAWLARISRYGCVITRATNGIDRHHVLGREARKNKLHIGRWFVYPLIKDLHDIHSDDLLNVTNHKNAFKAEYGKESDLFAAMCAEIKAEDGCLPFDDEVLQAIMDTNA